MTIMLFLHLCVAQLTLIDMVIYGALKAANLYSVRWSRVLRPLLLVNVTEGRQVTAAGLFTFMSNAHTTYHHDMSFFLVFAWFTVASGDRQGGCDEECPQFGCIYC